MENPWFWVWVMLAAILLIAEIFTATFFLLPFGVAAAVAAVLEYLGVSVGWQWVAFIAVSAALLVVVRRYADRLTHEPPILTGVDRLLGQPGVVVEQITPRSVEGRVRVEREEWRADSADGTTLAVGTVVTVERIDGTHLVVRAGDEGSAS